MVEILPYFRGNLVRLLKARMNQLELKEELYKLVPSKNDPVQVLVPNLNLTSSPRRIIYLDSSESE